MDILPVHFRALSFCGIWKEGTSNGSVLNTVYKVSVLILIYYTTTFQVIALCKSQNLNDFITILFLCLTYMALCLKWLNFILRRKDMLNLLSKFQAECCKPINHEEVAICQKYSTSAVNYFNYLMTITSLCGFFIVIQPLSNLGSPEMDLPFKTYHPFDISKTEYFTLAYVIQTFSEIYGIIIDITFDTLTYGFIQLATGQFELSSYRLVSYINSGQMAEKKREWVAHHLLVYEIVRDIESIFIGVIAPFFFCFLLTLCVTIFQMHKIKIFSMEFLTHFSYILFLLIEAFLYCFTGNELQIKCHDLVNTAYNSDWTSLSPTERKHLLLIMMTGGRGVTISCRGQCPLILDTYMRMVKSSYSAFNILKGCDI